MSDTVSFRYVGDPSLPDDYGVFDGRRYLTVYGLKFEKNGAPVEFPAGLQVPGSKALVVDKLRNNSHFREVGAQEPEVADGSDHGSGAEEHGLVASRRVGRRAASPG